jgi:hypothetical protein
MCWLDLETSALTLGIVTSALGNQKVRTRFAIFTLKLTKNRDKANLDAGSPRLERTFTCHCQEDVREAFCCSALDRGIALSSVSARLMECQIHDELRSRQGMNQKANKEVSSTW